MYMMIFTTTLPLAKFLRKIFGYLKWGTDVSGLK